MRKISKIVISFILMVAMMIIPVGIQQVLAVAGDPGDFPAADVPITSPIVASDYFTVAGSSNAFFHPDYNNVVVINKNETNQLGVLWSKDKISLNSKFSYEAYIYIGESADSASTNADGMTFTMQNDPDGTSAIGSNGHGLGAYTVAGREIGLINAISFEIDTLNGSFDSGLTGQHTGFVVPTDPDGASKHYDSKDLSVYDDAQGSMLSRWVQIDSTWVPNADGSGDLTVTLNGIPSTYHFTDYATYFGDDAVYFGYTGGTGSQTEIHAIALEKMPSSYSMHFDLNTPDLAGETMDTQILEKGDLAQPVTAPTRTGYTLRAWNTQADGNGTDWNFANMTMNEGDFTLYAQWQAIKYPLTFDLQGANSAAIAKQDVDYAQLATAVTNPTKQGYTFMGWNKQADGQGATWDFTSTTMPANPVTLFAQWKANKYALTFDLQGTDLAPIPKQDVDYDELATAVANPTKQGYSFKGWNTQAGGQGATWDFTSTTMPDNPVTLYAQWEAIKYPLTFDLQGADSAAIAKQDIDYDQLATAVTNPTKQGYTFMGWNKQADGQGATWDFASTVMPANPVTLFAQWQVIKYPLTFDLQGTDLAPIAKQEVDYNQRATAVDNPTKRGYTFKGWNTQADGQGTTWDFASTTMPANPVALYAQWEAVKYPLTFDLQGTDSDPIAKQDVDFDQRATAVDNPTKRGYTFKGWNTQADGKGVTWDFASTLMPDNAVTLYAQWQVIKYALTFDLQGADSAAIAKQDIDFDQLATAVTNPTKRGYTFMGWNTQADGKGTTWDFKSTTMPENDVILYAQWKKNAETLSTNVAKTGDDSNVAILITLWMGAGTSLLLIRAKNRKKV